MAGYNYSKFEASEYNLDQFTGPQLGHKAPDVTLEKLDGSMQRLLDFEGDFLVLEMGSITCPLFQARREVMTGLVTQFPDTHFAILYVREAHPGLNRPKHETDADKRANAEALQNEDREGREIWLDGIEGVAHTAFGQYPNSVFIINKNGCIVYMSDWNNPRATGTALRALKAGKPAPGMAMFMPPKPPVALRTLRDAGPGATADFFVGLPRLVWKNLIKRNLRLMMGKTPKIEPDASC